MITHNLELANEADRVITIEDGKIAGNNWVLESEGVKNEDS